MRKLYWYECEEKEVEMGLRFNHNKQLGGLGLTTSTTRIKSGVTEGEDEELGMLSIKVGFSLDKNELSAQRLVTVRNLDPNSYSKKNTTDKPECFIVSGKDYFSAYVKGVNDFTELIRDNKLFAATNQGEPTTNWDVNVLQVVPMYDGRLDREWGYWDMFEEEGYIYGRDKRTGEIYDLQHIEAELYPCISNEPKRVELWVISNQAVEGFNEIIDSLPLGQRHKDPKLAKWAEDLTVEHFEHALNRINHTRVLAETITVERYK